ncbi:MAG TPA: sulfatase-like hydrolase/transferase [Acidimicrobiales bacterium]
MTALDDVAEPASAAAGGDAGGGSAATVDEGRPWYAAEALLALEVAGLGAFAFSRSILDTFGRSPETFVARGADTATIVAFGLVVALVPALTLALVGLAGRPFGPTVRRCLHLGLVAVVGGLAVWQIGQTVTGYPPESEKLVIAGTVGALAFGALRWWWPPTRTFLRFVGAASVVFLVQFLFLSPTSSLVFGDGPQFDDEAAAEVAADLGDDPPPVVLVLFDALPTASLLDGTGQVDAEAFPNFGRLAATADWYRNHTSIAAFTGQSVPAILTGRFRPPGDAGGLSADDDKNIFTLLGGAYEMHGREAITRMCPDDLCPRASSPGLPPLLGDAVATWTGGQTDQEEFDLPGALGEDRYDKAERWIAEQDLSGPRPQMIVHHIVLPHGDWYLTPDGEPYEPAEDLPVGSYGLGWTESGRAVGRQRHLVQLQAADALLGQTFASLDEAGLFDDALIVVTADHGEAFRAGELMRGLSAENAADVMWTPLFVKAPGQDEPSVEDANVMGVDVVPTIADVLGVDLPWDVDGIPAADAGSRDDTKLFQANRNNQIEPRGDGPLIELDDTAATFADVLAADSLEWDGPDAVWRRTPHGELFGRQVDDLRRGDPADVTISVDRLDEIAAARAGERPLIEVVGDADLPEGAVVAYAVDGTLGAVTTVEPSLGYGHHGLVHALLPPRLLDGDNELAAYLVEGPVGDEVLRPLTVRESD